MSERHCTLPGSDDIDFAEQIFSVSLAGIRSPYVGFDWYFVNVLSNLALSVTSESYIHTFNFGITAVKNLNGIFTVC